MVKTNKNFIQSFLHSSGTTALAIVLLFVSVGAVLLPSLFADSPTPKVTATAQKNASYQVKVAWSGQSSSKWIYQYAAPGKSTVKKTVDNSVTSATVGSLTCGLTYTFKVAAADKAGNTTSSYGSDTAVAPCPSATLSSFTAAASNYNLTASWKNTAGFDTSYTLYIKVGSGSYVGHTTTATNSTIGGSCHTTYTAYVSASAGGQTGSGSATKSVTTAACPAPPVNNPTPPTNNPTPPASGGGSSTKKSTGSSSKQTTTTKAAAPATPTNFAADAEAGKIIELTWTAVTGNIDHYLVNRSTDDSTWQQIANVTATSYEDTTADFATTYYYQLQAVGSDGQTSGLATTQATTGSFVSSLSTITSDDKLATMQVPSGAIAQSYNCTLSSDENSLANIPAGQSTLLGPYDILCIGGDGTVINNFKKPVTITLKTASVASGYSNLTARTSTDQGWDTVKATYNPKTKQLQFTLTSAKSFAVFGQKHHSPLGAILLILLILLALGATVFGFIFWRRRTPARVEEAANEMTAEQEFNQALAAPNCSHLALAQQVVPSSQGCLECEQQHTQWNALRICLICGHVGCSDDSPQEHALKHYRETGHPIVYAYNDPNGNIGWCYVDQTYI